MKRIPSLDGLRALSIVLVFSGHLYGTSNYPRNAFTHALSEYAHFGVQVFFVISGFLITLLLLREHDRTGRIDLRSFYLRRTLRIFPAAFAYITAMAILHYPLGYLRYAYTYTMCYAGQGRPWVLGHLWSLSVEEQFYLFWPLAMAFAFSWRRKAGIAVLLGAPIARLLFWQMGMRDIDEYFPAVADNLAAGCLLACYRSELLLRAPILTRTYVFLPLVALALATPLIALRVREYILLGGLIPILIAVCLFAATERADWALNNRLTGLIGLLSYSLYLWQQPFLNRNSEHWWTAFPVNILLALRCAGASYLLVEKPFLRLKARMERRRPAVQVVASASSGALS
jgi:peptidoglycan/LPS O-acetylase OafA/YrhL